MVWERKEQPLAERQTGQIIFHCKPNKFTYLSDFHLCKGQNPGQLSGLSKPEKRWVLLPPACPTFYMGRPGLKKQWLLLHNYPEDRETCATERAREGDFTHSSGMKRKSKATRFWGSSHKHAPDFPGLQRWNQGSSEWFRHRGTNKLAAWMTNKATIQILFIAWECLKEAKINILFQLKGQTHHWLETCKIQNVKPRLDLASHLWSSCL